MSDSTRSIHPPHFVITHDSSLHGEDTPENREVVRRIHACVNACEGISTEELEKGIVQDMRRVLGQVAPLLEERNQRAAAQTERSSPSVKPSSTLRKPIHNL
jgi:hypothetical protein